MLDVPLTVSSECFINKGKDYCCKSIEVFIHACLFFSTVNGVTGVNGSWWC